MRDKNLVPEVRADRNGRLVTRHVRADNASSKKKNPLPAPQQNKIDHKAKQRERERDTERMRLMLIELTRVGVDVMGDTQAQHNVHHLIKTDRALAKSIIEHLKTASDAERDIWIHQFSYDQLTPADWRDETDYMQSYRNAIAFNPLASVMADQQPPTTHAMHFARSLIYDATEVARENGRENDTSWIKAVMLVSETHAKAHDTHRKRISISALEDDINFVQHHWEEVEKLVPELVRRSNATKGFIMSLLDNEVVTLNEGVL